MLPNHFIVLWNDQPVGRDFGSGGYPFRTDRPGSIVYWPTRSDAQAYVDVMQRSDSEGRYATMVVREVQFRLVDDAAASAQAIQRCRSYEVSSSSSDVVRQCVRDADHTGRCEFGSWKQRRFLEPNWRSEEK